MKIFSVITMGKTCWKL